MQLVSMRRHAGRVVEGCCCGGGHLGPPCSNSSAEDNVVIYQDPVLNLKTSNDGHHLAEALLRKLRVTSVMKETTDKSSNIAQASQENPKKVEMTSALPGNE